MQGIREPVRAAGHAAALASGPDPRRRMYPSKRGRPPGTAEIRSMVLRLARQSLTVGYRQRAAFFVARLRGGVNSSAIAAMAEGTRR
jgi:hypothetical protein